MGPQAKRDEPDDETLTHGSAGLPVDTAHWGQLELRERVGAGGFGEVWRAWDQKLEREVALKLLHSTGGLSPDSAAIREARALACIHHPNVASVYGLDVHNGRLGFAVEFIHGRNLARIVAEEGPLGPAECIAVGHDLCRAIAAVHGAGLLHSDIKPNNIMREKGGRIVLVDFGLSQKLSDSTSSFSGGGTLPYMAPELLRGEGPSRQTDIYAIGATLFYLLTGTNHREGKTPAQLARSPVRLLTDLRPDLPAGLTRVVEQALAPIPSDRFPTAGAMAAALDGLHSTASQAPAAFPRKRTAVWAALSLLLVLIAATLWAWKRPSSDPGPLHQKVAVLPFTYSGNDPQGPDIAGGLVEVLSSRLAQMASLRANFSVIPFSEVRSTGATDAETAGRNLAATHVITGHLQAIDDRIRLVVNLVSAQNREVLRSAVIDSPGANYFVLQDQVVDSLSRMFDFEASRTPPSSGGQPVAYRLYLAGRGALHRRDRENDLASAIRLFEQAIVADPKLAVAHAGLAEADWYRFLNTRDRTYIESGLQHADRALAIDPELPPLLITYARFHTAQGQHDLAIGELKRALELSPSSPDAYATLGTVYQAVGRPSDAETNYKAAVELSPGDWNVHHQLGAFYYSQGRYSDAASAFRAVVNLTPDNARALNALGLMLLYLEKFDEAKPLFDRSLAVQPSFPAYNNLGLLHYLRGEFSPALAAFEAAAAANPAVYSVWGNVAQTWERLGNIPKARILYQKALDMALEERKSNPQSALAIVDIGFYRAVLGAGPAALAETRQAVRLDPNNPDVLLRAAETFELAAQRDEALALVDRAVQARYPKVYLMRNYELLGLYRDPRFIRKYGTSPLTEME